jgi:hypothetical protein
MIMITYAKAGGPPDNWWGLRVFDLDTGQEVLDVEECNTDEGWLIRHKRDGKGNFYVDPGTDKIASERVEGRFEIRPKGEPPCE